jgi:hypothetical protein
MSTGNSSMPHVRHPVWKVWQNPIFRRYCRSRLRLRGAGVALLIAVLIAGFIVAMTGSIGMRSGANPQDAARPAIIALLVLQSMILFISGTAQVAGGMTAERDEGVIDYQRLIPMSPLSKVLGYLFGLPVREYAMFFATLPFTAWALWRGGVSWHTWLPLYLILFSSTLLYHFTGLVTGTVVRNRRWAFLISIGLVFALYTIIPQMAKFGLVFFKYLSITPVFQESLPGLLPETAGAVVRAGQQLAPSAKFFNLDFSEAVFTVFSQGGLILTFTVMLCRKWRRAESHLLGKTWAVGFFVWIQFLLLGNAIPLIDPGNLFPSRGFSRMVRIMPDWSPQPGEAVLMSGIYGFVTMALMFCLAAIITPSTDHQRRGWRSDPNKTGRRAFVLDFRHLVAAVRAFHQRGVQRDDFQQPAQAEFFLQQEFRDFELRQLERRIDEQLARVVARLAVDVDGAGVVRSERVVVPEIIGEPCVRLGDGDEVPGAFGGDARPTFAGTRTSSMPAVFSNKSRTSSGSRDRSHTHGRPGGRPRRRRGSRRSRAFRGRVRF